MIIYVDHNSVFSLYTEPRMENYPGIIFVNVCPTNEEEM